MLRIHVICYQCVGPFTQREGRREQGRKRRREGKEEGWRIHGERTEAQNPEKQQYL